MRIEGTVLAPKPSKGNSGALSSLGHQPPGLPPSLSTPGCLHPLSVMQGKMQLPWLSKVGMAAVVDWGSCTLLRAGLGAGEHVIIWHQPPSLGIFWKGGPRVDILSVVLYKAQGNLED